MSVLPPLPSGQHAVRCCHLPPISGKSGSRSRIPPAPTPAGRGKAPRASAAAPDGWHHSGLAPATSFHSPAVGFPLSPGEGTFRAPRNLAAAVRFPAGLVGGAGGRKRKF